MGPRSRVWSPVDPFRAVAVLCFSIGSWAIPVRLIVTGSSVHRLASRSGERDRKRPDDVFLPRFSDRRPPPVERVEYPSGTTVASAAGRSWAIPRREYSILPSGWRGVGGVPVHWAG